MSNSAQVDGPVTVHGDGVSVTKEFADDADFPIPTIRFVVENEREEAVTVVVVEDVPDGFAIDDLGFHPDYLGDHWATEKDHATFEYDVPAGEDARTLYAVRIDDEGRAGEFLTEPTLEVSAVGDEGDGEMEVASETHAETDPDSASEEGEVSGDDADASDNADASDDADASDGAEESGDDGGSDGEPVEKASLDVDIDSEVERAVSSEVPTIELDGVEDEVEGVSMAAVGPESGTVVERLVAELQRIDVDAETTAILREKLDLGLPSEADARIGRLQSRVEDLAAYTDALEDFLDEEGTAQQVIEDYRTTIDALREDVADVRGNTSANASDVDGLAGDLTNLEAHVGAVEGRLDEVASHADAIEESLSTTDDHLDDVEGDLRDAEEDIASTAGDLSTVEERVDDLEDEADAVDEDLDALEGRVTATEEDVDVLEGRTESAEDDLSSVQSAASDNAEEIADLDAYVRNMESALESDVEVVEEDVSNVEADVADLASEVEDFAEWRDQLGEMFQ